MTESPADYHQRLRRDKVTGAAVVMCILAMMLPAMGVVPMAVKGPHIDARGNPLYWLILSVPASWAWWVQDYSPRALRTVRPLLFAAPFINASVLIVASLRGVGMTPYWWMLGLTCGFTTAGGLLYDRSMLGREGAEK